LSSPNTTVSVDGSGQTHFIFVLGDSTLDLVYTDLSFCNGYFMGSLSGTLSEGGISINQYVAPIASLSNNILFSLIDFVTNDPNNFDSFQQSIQTINYQLLEGCIHCNNCSPRILADNGDPGDTGPGGSSGGTGWYEEDCLAPVISPTSQSFTLCTGQCLIVPISVSDPNANILGLSSGGAQVNVYGNTVEICNNYCSYSQVTLVASNQCGQSTSTINIQTPPSWINVFPFSQDICSGSSATINVNIQGGCGFNSNTLNYFMNLPPSVVLTNMSASGNLLSWMPFTPNFINTSSSPQTVEIYFQDFCSGFVTQAIVVVYPIPNANAGADQVICGNNLISLNGTASSSTFTYWLSSGTGTFTDPNSISTTYQPSSTDITNGTITFSLFVNDQLGLCQNLDNIFVSFNSIPAVSSGPDQSTCSNSPISLVGSISGSATSATWTSSGSGTFANSSSLTTTYTPSTADISSGSVILTLTTNDPIGPCSSISDQLVLSFGTSPSAVAGPDQAVCSSSQISIVGSIDGSATSATWSTTGTGTFANSNSLTSTYSPSAADISVGSVILTLTTNDPAGACSSISDQLVLTFETSPNADAGPDQAVCSSSPISLVGSIGGSATSANWTSSGTGTFANSSSLITTYTPSTADISSGSVILILTTNDPVGPCSSISDEVVITFDSAPTIDAGSDQSVCSTTEINLSGNLTGASSATWSSSGSGTFTSANNLNTSYIPSGADINSGSVILTLTSNNATSSCASVSDQITITLIYQPQNPQITLTNNSASTTLYPNTSYQWVRCPGYLPISGSSTATFTSNYSGGLAVIVSNQCGTDTSDCVNYNLSSVEELQGSYLEIYPNPTLENTTVEVSEGLYGKELYIQDFSGRVVLSHKITASKNELFLSSLASGSYYLIVEGYPIVKKIIKN
jgi:hypothetical protein